MIKLGNLNIKKIKNKNKFKIILIGTTILLLTLSLFKQKNNVNKKANNDIKPSKVQSDLELSFEEEKLEEQEEDIEKPLVIDIKDDVFSTTEVTVCNSEFKLSEELNNKINNHIKNFGGDCSFIAVNLNDGMSIGYNVDKAYATASTIKVAFSFYSFKEMDKGNGSLEELKLYEERFRRDGSGVLKNKPSGTNYTLKELFYNTLHYSDNVAYYMVYDRFYGEGYNNFIKELGCNNLYLNNGRKWGEIDARSMALVWQEIYKYKDESENGKYLFELLTNADYNYIKQGMEKYESAHKSGWTPRETHDSAIVFANDDYIVVTLNKNNGNYSSKSQLLKISSCIEEVIDEYTIYKENNLQKEKVLTK